MTWDVRITSKVRSRDNALKQVLRALPKEEAENTDHVHVLDGWSNQLKRELQLIHHFVVQSACNQRFPKICNLLTDCFDRMCERRERADADIHALSELAFQGVDSPYLDLFSRVPARFIAQGRLKRSKLPLWKASSNELLAKQWHYKAKDNCIDAFRDADDRYVGVGVGVRINSTISALMLQYSFIEDPK